MPCHTPDEHMLAIISMQEEAGWVKENSTRTQEKLRRLGKA